VEDSDITILAEACHLHTNYIVNEGKGGNLFVASKDGHFVPIRRRHWMYMGREITDEIRKRFEIICEHPGKIKQMFVKKRDRSIAISYKDHQSTSRKLTHRNEITFFYEYRLSCSTPAGER
jgi:hypothetical protein